MVGEGRNWEIEKGRESPTKTDEDSISLLLYIFMRTVQGYDDLDDLLIAAAIQGNLNMRRRSASKTITSIYENFWKVTVRSG